MFGQKHDDSDKDSDTDSGEEALANVRRIHQQKSKGLFFWLSLLCNCFLFIHRKRGQSKTRRF